MTRIGFGIDLAGYSTGRTAVAVAHVSDGKAALTLLSDSALSKKSNGDDDFETVVKREADCVLACLQLGPIAIDVPIDLQGLPNTKSPRFLWQLTKRPIDKFTKALAPLADRIGAPVARFAAIMSMGSLHEQLGQNIFETYPACAYAQLGFSAQSYKGKNGGDGLKRLCEQLQVNPALHSDDEVDAVICAITAAQPPECMCTSDDLDLPSEFELPRGYRILKHWGLRPIEVERCNFESWFQRHSQVR